MKNMSAKINTNSFYKNALFVGIIALSLFNLSGAHAQSMTNKRVKGNMVRQSSKMGTGQKGVMGTVTSINGDTLTVSQTIRSGGKNTATTTKIYTVDASSATIIKYGATSSISSIVNGDIVSISGTISGINVTAKMIRDGISGTMRAPNEMIGNGQPVVEGKITSINGNTIVITNNSNVTYTIDVTNTKISLNGSTSSISTLQTNEDIIVQGTVNGTNVIATNVIVHNPTTQNSNVEPQQNKGFLQKTKNFFKKLFGF